MYKPEEPTPPLAPLMEDVLWPDIAPRQKVSAVNLWMSIGGSRSSIHYDPSHNLLCVVTGRKRVRLWSPEISHQLYPKALAGEASNHSAVDFAAPDFSIHPRFKEAMAVEQSVDLYPGDVLFIPEGWWHQVDSDHRTIAVNFWWDSEFTTNYLGTHMDSYYTRRLVSSVLALEKARRLAEVSPLPISESRPNPELEADCVSRDEEGAPAKRVKTSSSHGVDMDMMRLLAAIAAKAVKQHQDGDISGTADTGESTSANDGPSLERVVLSMPTRSLRRTLYVMAKNTPRTLEALITHAMTATAAEIITSKFEEGAPSASSEDPEAHPADDDNTFYEAFYSVFGGEPDRALTALVKRKEAFAHEALLALVRDLVTGH